MSNVASSIAVPRVSVVMSVYNEELRVGRAIESILRQSFRDFELIVVNDGSHDETPEILDAYQRQDPRVRVIHQSNRGLTLSLIRGCDDARGEYIARHDADDWSEPARFAEQVRLLDSNNNVGIVSCGTQYVGPSDELLEQVIRRDEPTEATRKLLDECQGPAAHGSVMFRRSLYEQVGGYRSEFYFGQDSDLWMRMCEQSLIAYDSNVMYFLRRDPLSISGRMGTIQRDFGRWGQECKIARREGRPETPILDSARLIARELRAGKQHRSSSWALATMAYLIGTTLENQGDQRCQSYFWQAIQSNPFYWRAWLRLLSIPRRD